MTSLCVGQSMPNELFNDVLALHTALLRENPREFVSRYILEPIPFIFSGNICAWVEWKHVLADALKVDPRDIVLTGSAALGWSLNPNKNFSKFHCKSDIDCAVIDGYFFETAWRYLRQQRVSWLTLPPANRAAIDIHRKNYIFTGTIAADRILALLPFAKTWQAGLDHMARITPSSGREVKMRIYKDFDALRYYQTSNIRTIRDRISVNIEVDDDSSDQTIGTEDL